MYRWFHGFLSSIEAERFLERQPPGTFLIRFSKSKPGSFAIAYVDANNRNAVTHTLITCAPPSGFKIEEAYNRSAKGRLFVTLNEIVEFYSYILKLPFRSDLSRQRYIQSILCNTIDACATVGSMAIFQHKKHKSCSMENERALFCLDSVLHRAVSLSLMYLLAAVSNSLHMDLLCANIECCSEAWITGDTARRIQVWQSATCLSHSSRCCDASDGSAEDSSDHAHLWEETHIQCSDSEDTHRWSAFVPTGSNLQCLHWQTTIHDDGTGNDGWRTSSSATTHDGRRTSSTAAASFHECTAQFNEQSFYEWSQYLESTANECTQYNECTSYCTSNDS